MCTKARRWARALLAGLLVVAQLALGLANGLCAHAYAFECAHENVDVLNMVVDATVSPLDEYTHTESGYTVDMLYCTDCFAELGEVEGSRRFFSKVGAHEFVDGMCWICDYAAACAHEHVYEYTLRSDEQYVDFTAEQHLISYCEYRVRQCEACGAYWLDDDAQGPLSEWEDHQFIGDTCAICGYQRGCRHADAYESVERMLLDCAALDGTWHSATYMTVMCRRCKACGYEWQEPMGAEPVIEREPHEFVDGVCRQCGYEACLHASADCCELRMDVVYDYVDENEHSVTYQPVNEYFCADCGATWRMEVPGGRVTVLESHEFAGGACIYCGGRAPCLHENASTREERRNEVYEYIDSARHRVKYQPVYVYICNDCGDSWEFALSDEAMSAVEAHEFIDGACRQCGCKEPCKHGDAMARAMRADVVYGAVDATQHSVTYQPVTAFTCPDCGAEWEEKDPGGPVTVLEAHEFVDGACRHCGCMEPCRHNNANPREGRRDAVYAPVDDDQHGITYQPIIIYTCPDCGAEWEEALGDRVAGCEPHEFAAGVCRQCGWKESCRHNNATACEKRADESYVALDDAQHSLTYQPVLAYVCPDCGATWEEEVPGGKVTIAQAHEFEDDFCKRCGLEKPCKHADVLKYSGRKDKVYAYANEAQHTVVYQPTVRYVCMDCGYEWEEETGDRASALEPHEFIDDICQYCGCKAPCRHEHAVGHAARKDEVYEPIDGAQHGITYQPIMIYFCAECGAEWEEEVLGGPVTIPEDHEYADGFCKQCGQKEPCRHGNVTTQYARRDETYAIIDDAKHSVTYKPVVVCVCPDCGETWSEEVAGGEMTLSEAHEFENGRCIQCGFSEPCRHADLIRHESRRDETYASLDATQHSITYQPITVYTCRDCGAEWAEEAPGGPITIPEPHEFIDGTCKYCGCKEPCRHAHVAQREGRRDAIYAPVDDDRHSIAYQPTIVYTCEDCGAEWEEANGDRVTVFEPHEFMDEVCRHCGWREACRHGNASTHEARGDATYRAVDAEQHSVTYQPITVHTCLDCGASWEAEAPGGKVTICEAHEFIDGSCRQCGLQEPCRHDNAIKRSGRKDKAYAPADEALHTVEYQPTLEYVCIDCGYEWEEETGDREMALEPHEFIDDICRYCGYRAPCRHEHAVAHDARRDETYALIDAAQHGITYQPIKIYICEECGAEWEEEVPGGPVTILEAHEYADSLCKYCGGREPCRHANVLRHESRTDETYAAIDEAQHSATYQPVTAYVCAECGEKWEQAHPGGPVKVIEQHEFIDGVCRQCGYMEPCGHENAIARGKRADAVYAGIDATQHSMTYQPMTVYTCPDCGAEWEEAVPGGPVTILESHEFIDGACRHCGCKEPCRHANTHQREGRRDEIYAILDDSLHSVTYQPVIIYSCNDCGAEWEEATGERATAFEPHSLAGEVCRYCGWQATCRHQSATTAEKRGDVEYISLNAEQHGVTYQPIIVHACPDCGAVWEETVPGGRVTVPEPHEFVDGACAQCGCAAACTHAHATGREIRRDEVYALMDAERHSVSYQPVMEYTCPDCSACWEEAAGERATVLEPHALVDGVCSRCGWHANCTHTHVEVTDGRLEVQYVSRDDSTHELCYYPIRSYHCLDCDLRWQSARPDEPTCELAPHMYTGEGVCVQCGHVNSCAHADAVSYEQPCDLGYTAVDARNHRRSYYPIYVRRCEDCGMRWEDPHPDEQTSVLERHNFVDGVCADCGYLNECAHAEVEVGGYDQYVSCTCVDAHGHSATYYHVTTYSCPECGERWEAPRPAEPATELRPHRFGDGVCLDCGYVNKCAHARVEIGEYRRDAACEPLDADSHSVSYYPIQTYYCPDCGARWEDDAPAQPVRTAEPHDFAGAVCTLCGYERRDTGGDSGYVPPGHEGTPGATPKPSESPAPTATPRPSESPAPSAVPAPSESPAPSAAPAPSESPAPSAAPMPSKSPTPSALPTPTASAAPTPAQPGGEGPTGTAGIATARPEAAATALPESPGAALAPNYVRVPIEQWLRGPVTTAEPGIVEALMLVSRALQQGSERVQVWPLHLEELLTPAELAAFVELPLNQQAMAFMYAIGLGAQMDDVLEGAQMPVQLGEFIAGLDARIAALEPAQRTEYMLTLARCFPVSIERIGGADCYWFSFELIVVIDGAARMERYGCRYDAGTWRLHRLEVAELPDAEWPAVAKGACLDVVWAGEHAS